MVWLADYEAWGNTAKIIWREEKLESLHVSADELQPIRFQGQTIDQETGLHYNRFRYFDPDVGMFVSRDPIGLLGGNNVFQYAPNPTGWIDPWGLKCTKAKPTRFHTRTVRETARLRATFERTRKKNFLKYLAKQPDSIKKYGVEAVEKMKQGKVPDGMVVHHKKPLFRGGNNRNNNLDLISEKYHTDHNKALHWYEEGQNPYGLN